MTYEQTKHLKSEDFSACAGYALKPLPKWYLVMREQTTQRKANGPNRTRDQLLLSLSVGEYRTYFHWSVLKSVDPQPIRIILPSNGARIHQRRFQADW